MDLITIIGLIAAVLTSISFLPQAIKTIKTKQTKDLSLGMYLVLTFGILLWIIYGVVNADLPIILANGVTFIFTVTILVLIIKHK